MQRDSGVSGAVDVLRRSFRRFNPPTAAGLISSYSHDRGWSEFLWGNSCLPAKNIEREGCIEAGRAERDTRNGGSCCLVGSSFVSYQNRFRSGARCRDPHVQFLSNSPVLCLRLSVYLSSCLVPFPALAIASTISHAHISISRSETVVNALQSRPARSMLQVTA